MLFNIFGSPREHRSIENPQVSLSDPRAWETLFGFSSKAVTSEPVNRETAMRVPAVWACVDKLAGAISALPIHVYRDTPEGRERADTDPAAKLLHGCVNSDFLTSAQWRRELMCDLALDGRSLWWIQRDGANRPINLWRLDTASIRLEIKDGRKVYRGVNRTYDAGEVLDFVWMPGRLPGEHLNPIELHRDAIGLAIAATRYAGTTFDSGGVPQTVAYMPPASSPAATDRSVADLFKSANRSRSERRPFTPIPGEIKIEKLGFEPDKTQMIQVREFQIREICRIWNVPPALIKDLSGATYSNTEQQNLAFVQHTLAPFLQLIEQELTAKLFGRKSSSFCEFNLEGLLRGDSTSRAEFISKMITNGVMTPAEARQKENLPPKDDYADKLFIQGAMVALEHAGEKPEPPPVLNTPPAEISPEEESDEDE